MTPSRRLPNEAGQRNNAAEILVSRDAQAAAWRYSGIDSRV